MNIHAAAASAAIQGLNRITRQRDELQRRIDTVLTVCDRHQRGALRWENPLPVPEWVGEIQAILLGDNDQTGTDPSSTATEAGE